MIIALKNGHNHQIWSQSPTVVLTRQQWSWPVQLCSQPQAILRDAPTMATAANNSHRHPNNNWIQPPKNDYSPQVWSQPPTVALTHQLWSQPPLNGHRPPNYGHNCQQWSQLPQQWPQLPTMVIAGPTMAIVPRKGRSPKRLSQPSNKKLCHHSYGRSPDNTNRPPTYGHSLEKWSLMPQQWSRLLAIVTAGPEMVTGSKNVQPPDVFAAPNSSPEAPIMVTAL